MQAGPNTEYHRIITSQGRLQSHPCKATALLARPSSAQHQLSKATVPDAADTPVRPSLPGTPRAQRGCARREGLCHETSDAGEGEPRGIQDVDKKEDSRSCGAEALKQRRVHKSDSQHLSLDGACT